MPTGIRGFAFQKPALAATNFLRYIPHPTHSEIEYMDTFEQMIEKERARLGKLRDDLTAQQSNIVTQLADIDKELAAIGAYERAKQGKPERQTKMTKNTRAPRGAKREELLFIIAETPNLTRGEIIEKLGIKGEKSQEQGISNALATMKKVGTITAIDGKYTIGRGV